MNNSNPTLRKAYKLLRKIAKQLGNPDLYFSAQIGTDSSKDQAINTYAAMIASPRDGIEPITFVAVDKDDFINLLKDALKNKYTPEKLEVAFHEGQILANNRSTEFHQTRIDEINDPTLRETRVGEVGVPEESEEASDDKVE